MDDDDEDDDDDVEVGDVKTKYWKAQDLAKKLTDFKFLATLHFLADLLGIINETSKFFQHDLLADGISDVVSQINGLLGRIRRNYLGDTFKWQRTTLEFLKKIPALPDLDGDSSGSFKVGKHTVRVSEIERDDFYGLVREYAASAHENIDLRFPQRSIITSFSVFCPSELQDLEEDDLDDYGNGEIETLIEHYAKTKPGFLDADKLRDEWPGFKQYMFEHRRQAPHIEAVPPKAAEADGVDPLHQLQKARLSRRDHSPRQCRL